MTDKEREGTRMIIQGLKQCIRDSGLSITEIAKRGGVTRQYIHLVLRSSTNSTFETVERIYEACDASFGDWLKDTISDRYGRNRTIHDQVELILGAKGDYGRMMRNFVAAVLALRAAEGIEARPERARETDGALHSKRRNDKTSVKTGH